MDADIDMDQGDIAKVFLSYSRKDRERAQGISDVYCLGDVIGYGPNPRDCVDQAVRYRVCIMGNHDQAALFDPDGFNPVALQAIYWTRDQLDTGPGGPSAANRSASGG